MTSYIMENVIVRTVKGELNKLSEPILGIVGAFIIIWQVTIFWFLCKSTDTEERNKNASA